MRLVLLGLNYAPEPVGIGPFTAGWARWLAARGHAVTVVCGHPYYPEWRIADGAGGGWRTEWDQGVRVIRCPLYVPARPTGVARVAHHLSFWSSVRWALADIKRRCRPDLVVSVAPSLLSAHLARRFGVPHWLHVQDFELEAAAATGQLPGGGLMAERLSGVEGRLLRADRVSSLTPAMCGRLRRKGVPADRIVLFPNWATIDGPAPAGPVDALRAELGIGRARVALYAGTLCAKQGLGLILDAARTLADRRDLLFLICGEGAERATLAAQAAGLPNVRFGPLQPAHRLPALLSLASVHLLPQMAEAADLVLPSKLANMLASGRPVVASAATDTGLADAVAGCGRVTPPGDAAAFADAIVALLDDPGERERSGRLARQRAVLRWNKEAILHRIEQAMLACVANGGQVEAISRVAPVQPMARPAVPRPAMRA